MGLNFDQRTALNHRKAERRKAEAVKAEEAKKNAESANTCYKYQDELSPE